MTQIKTLAAVTVAAVAFLASACNKPAEQATSTSSAASPGAPARMTFKTTPDPVTTGENTFEVMLMQDDKPVDDAQVSVEFQMPAMPQMNMAEMKTKTDLTYAGGGLYRGKGQVMVAGNWNVTVMAMRGRQELANTKLSVTTK